jgi:hypothetical protein
MEVAPQLGSDHQIQIDPANPNPTTNCLSIVLESVFLKLDVPPRRQLVVKLRRDLNPQQPNEIDHRE